MIQYEIFRSSIHNLLVLPTEGVNTIMNLGTIICICSKRLVMIVQQYPVEIKGVSLLQIFLPCQLIDIMDSLF
jgi:hypothetical protein